MKRLVNGVETELADTVDGVSADKLPDRVMVHTPDGTHSAVAVRDGDKTLISYQGRQFTLEKTLARAKGASAAKTGAMLAPMPGQVVDVLVAEGDAVRKGDKLLVLEAMKVQQPYSSPFDGTVKQLPVAKGQQVNEGALLVLVEPVE